MSPRRKITDSTSENDNSTLEVRYDILKEPFQEEGVPSELLDLFLLVYEVDHIRWAQFPGYTDSNESNTKERNEAAHDYDKSLARRASRLHRKCNDAKRENSTENEWMSVLTPEIFYRFDREEEETALYHHCFVCRLHYPPASRPMINRHSERLSAPRETHERFQFCEAVKHVNLSNFDMARDLNYIKDLKKTPQSRKGSTKPDLTIGFCTYNTDTYPWQERLELAKDHRVQLFDRRLLYSLWQHFKIPSLYHCKKNQAKDDSPQFPFALWEAKSATAADTHLTTVNQTAQNLRNILMWQRLLYEKSRVDRVPLVWYFNNIGSDWKLYGCYSRPKSGVSDDCVYILTELWSGNLNNKDMSLRLLYIVDIIAIWAEHDYKPFIGYCISRLEAVQRNERPPLDQETLRAVQLEVNRANFKWLFDRRTEQSNWTNHDTNSLRAPDRDGLTSRRRHSVQIAPEQTEENEIDRSGRPPSRSPNRMARPSIAHSISETPRKPPLWPSRQHIMPEHHEHVWILDADPDEGHLLVVRVDDNGTVLAPLVIFDGDEWVNPQFEEVIRLENNRHPSPVLWTFNKIGQHYMWSSMFENDRYFCNPRVQFCAILPLELKRYRHERRAKQYESFKPLLTALGISDLMSDLHHTADRWCTCRAPWNEHSRSMIQCDNTKCKLDWYHQRCVGLPENFQPKNTWLCPECYGVPKSMRVVHEDPRIACREDLFEASENRIHITKTLVQVWEKHAWPDKDTTVSLFEDIACSIDIDTRTASDVSEEGGARADKGCWALSKKSPDRLIMVRSADYPDGEADCTVEDLDAAVSSLTLGGRARE